MGVDRVCLGGDFTRRLWEAMPPPPEPKDGLAPPGITPGMGIEGLVGSRATTRRSSRGSRRAAGPAEDIAAVTSRNLLRFLRGALASAGSERRRPRGRPPSGRARRSRAPGPTASARPSERGAVVRRSRRRGSPARACTSSPPRPASTSDEPSRSRTSSPPQSTRHGANARSTPASPTTSSVLALRREERRLDLRDDVVGEPHRPVERHVDPRLADDLLREHAHRLARDERASR